MELKEVTVGGGSKN